MFGKSNSKKQNNSDEETSSPNDEQKSDGEIKTEILKQKLSGSPDIVFNEVILDENRKFTVVFVDGMTNSQMIDNFVLKPLIQESDLKETKNDKDLIDLIMLGTVYHCQRKLVDKLTDCYSDLLSGSVVLVFDDLKKAVTFEIKGFEKRGLSEPTNENVLKGAKESFIEVLRTNTALIRRRIPSSDLIINQMKIGKRTDTAVSVVYFDGIANQSIVDEVKRRLEKINIDGIVSPGVIESFLIDSKRSLFPEILYTERTDKFCANIMEGRVGIIVDGFPLAMIDPVDINSFLQAPEDYSQNFIYSSLYRIMRYLCALSSMILPAFYVSVTTFHQEMIPTALAGALIQTKEGITVVVGTVGYSVARRMPIPFFSAVKLISFIESFERFEAVMLAIWVAADFILITFFALVIMNIIKHLFSLSEVKYLATPVVSMGYIGSQYISAARFEREAVSIHFAIYVNLILLYIVPILILFIGKLRKKL